MEKKRMVANEQKAFLELHAVIGQSGFVEEGLQRRINSIKGARGWMHSAQALLAKVANQKRASEGGRFMTFKELDVVADAMRECCRMCSIDDPQQQKQCQYCKLLESLPTNKPDENARGCGYFTMWM